MASQSWICYCNARQACATGTSAPWLCLQPVSTGMNKFHKFTPCGKQHCQGVTFTALPLGTSWLRHHLLMYYSRRTTTWKVRTEPTGGQVQALNLMSFSSSPAPLTSSVSNPLPLPAPHEEVGLSLTGSLTVPAGR